MTETLQLHELLYFHSYIFQIEIKVDIFGLYLHDFEINYSFKEHL